LILFVKNGLKVNCEYWRIGIVVSDAESESGS